MFWNKLFCKDFSTVLSAQPDTRPFFLYNGKNHISGVTKSFDGNSAQYFLNKLSIGDNLCFEKDVDISTERVKVMMSRKRQIGWCEFGKCEFDALMENLDRKVSICVSVSNKGTIVGHSGEQIVWCEIDFSFPIHYDASEECVFIAKSGKMYHLSPTCQSAAKMQVPLSYANYRELRACPKCAKAHL